MVWWTCLYTLRINREQRWEAVDVIDPVHMEVCMELGSQPVVHKLFVQLLNPGPGGPLLGRAPDVGYRWGLLHLLTQFLPVQPIISSWTLPVFFPVSVLLPVQWSFNKVGAEVQRTTDPSPISYVAVLNLQHTQLQPLAPLLEQGLLQAALQNPGLSRLG